MKKYLFSSLFLITLIIQTGCTSSKSFFDSKIIIYRVEPDIGPITFNASFIDFYKDTINKIEGPFSLYEQEEKSFERSKLASTTPEKYLLSDIYSTSNVPFKFVKKGKSIYISYTFIGKKFEKEYFKISKTDSAEASAFDFLCDANGTYNWVKTKLTGDTTIKIPGKKIRCWIFTETYYRLFLPNKRSRIIYLDKKSLLPIQITEIYYGPNSKNPSIIDTRTYRNKIDSVFARPWNSSNKKWNYPKCWETGFTSLKENQ